MFTVGIFTTHIPYIAMFAFYAYFLIFGVQQVAEGKIQIVEKSIVVQTHLNSHTDIIRTNNIKCFYTAFTEELPSVFFEKNKDKQLWNHFGSNQFYIQNIYKNSLFGRPPPAFFTLSDYFS